MLFLINFGMDFLSLYLTGKLTHAGMKPHRMVAAAAMGALYGVLAVIWPRLSSISINGGMALLLSFVAFGKKGLLRNTALVWGSGALLGGIMSVLMAMGEPVYMEEEGGNGGSARYFILTFALALLFIRMVSARKSTRSAHVTLRMGEKTICFEALADSGNLLRDPLSGTPVIIVSPSLFPEEVVQAMTRLRDGGDLREVPYRIRIIPQKTVNGEGILCGFLPEEVMVNGVVKQAVVVPELGGTATTYGGYDGIVPAALC